MIAISLAIVMLTAPALAVIVCTIVRRARISEMVNLTASLITLVTAVPLPFITKSVGVQLGGYLLLDPFGTWVTLCVALVYALSSIYAVGYMRLLGEPQRLPQFYALFAGFALTTLIAPLMNNAGVYWIAVELTTLVSTFLVGFEHAPESIEAAWKYIVIVSAGISLALLGTVLFYWAGTAVLGPSYNMTWSALTAAAPHMNHSLVTLAFLLILVGYGTKVGLAPMHTWLPDAHSEAPAPVSALLSGGLLNTAMVGIVRLLSVTDHTGGGKLAHMMLLLLGILSLGIGTFFIVRQQGVKRLMAYSSVEHMGVIALGFGFGGLLGIGGAMYHMLNHSLNKSLMFFGAGVAMRSYGTKDMAGIRRFGVRFPWIGMLWLGGAVAITGAPPFGLFLSEFTILRAGFTVHAVWAAAFMLVLLIIVFAGFLNHYRRMYYTDVSDETVVPVSGPWFLVPMAAAGAPLLILGLWWPEVFTRIFDHVANMLELAR